MTEKRITEASLARAYEPRLGMSDGALDQFIHTVEAVKEAVPVKEYLRGQGVEVRHNRARCIVHDGDNPQSFAVYPERRRWYCFKCHRGGDVVDLAQVVEDHSKIWEAVVALATRYDVELPGRPESWCRRQDEKEKIRRQIFIAMRESYRRRFYRIYAPITLDGIEDPDERKAEGERIWEDMLGPAGYAAKMRLDRRGHV